MKSAMSAAARGWAVCAALAAAAPAQAGVWDFLFGKSGGSEAKAEEPARTGRRVWPIGEFSEVRLVAAEPGAAPNAHPVNLGPENLRALLAPVRFEAGGADEALLSQGEVGDLVESLHAALRAAQPGEDVLLLATSRHGGGVLEAPTAVTARVFATPGMLNLIVHDARFEFYNLYRGSGKAPEFVYGSRTAAAKVALVGPPGAVARRPDWLQIPLAGPAAQAATPAAPAAVAPAAPMPQAAPPAAAATPAPARPAEPPRAATPGAPAAAAPGNRPRDASFFDEQEQRLIALKRLRDRGLISEEEYQQKRKEVLQGL